MLKATDPQGPPQTQPTKSKAEPFTPNGDWIQRQQQTRSAGSPQKAKNKTRGKKKETENVSHYFTIKILISPKGFCYKIQVGKAEKLFVMQTMQKVGQ